MILAVNCYSVNLATNVQNIFTAAKLVAIAIIVCGGAYKLILGNNFGTTCYRNILFMTFIVYLLPIVSLIITHSFNFTVHHFIPEFLINHYRNILIACKCIYTHIHTHTRKYTHITKININSVYFTTYNI